MIGFIICIGRISRYLEENIMEDLESGNLSYTTIREFLSDLKKKFEEDDNKIMKVADLKKIEQRSKIIEEFV